LASAASRIEVEPLQQLLERDRRRGDAPAERLATTLSSLTIARAPAAARAEGFRLGRAWERIGLVSRQVGRFETELAEGQRKIEGLVRERQANEAGLTLVALGSRCEQIDRAIREAKALAEVNEEPRREIAFYEEWHRRSRAKLNAGIADTAGLGEQVAISGFGIAEATHPDVFANTRAIHAVRTKVRSFGRSLRDPDAAEPVRKVLAEARQAKADLRGLQERYRKDDAARRFLAEGAQDELIDEPLQKLEEAAKAAWEERTEAAEGGEDDAAKAPPAHERRDPVGELIDAVLGGESARIHPDRGAERGPGEGIDVREIDAVAADTWIGSGEGAKFFSDVFVSFLPAEGAIAVHHPHRGGGPGKAPARGPAREAKTGFFAGLFEHLEGFADRVGGWAKKGERALGKGTHQAELAMHGLGEIEGAARKVQGFAGKAEKFLGDLGLDRLAGFAAKTGGAAGWVEDQAQVVHGAARKAGRWMGKGKTAAAKVEQGAHAAAEVFDEAAHGSAGELLSLFQASRGDAAIEGRRSPDKVALGPVLDEPRRLDLTTLSRMERFLGDDLSGVRIHTGAGAAEVTRRFNADAVTVHDHVFFAPGRFNPSTAEGEQLIAHELTHVLQRGRKNLDVRTAESEALHSERSYGRGPAMETLNLSRPAPDFKLEPLATHAPSGVYTAKRTRSRGHEATAKDAPPDGEELLEQVSGRVYELLMDELEQAFESR
jgi:hypothetical protein